MALSELQGCVVKTTDDISAVYRQHFSEKDLEIWFGPLSTTLYWLFSNGFHIEAYANFKALKYGRKVNIYLTNDKVKYKIGKIPFDLVDKSFDLTGFFSESKAIKLLSNPSSCEKDPWDELKKAYPVKKKKKDIVIGNMSLKEYVRAM